MKKLLLMSVMVIGLLSSITAFAQTKTSEPLSGPVLVASVNIYNAKIISNIGRDYTISFNISNNIGVQSQIKYSVQLTKTISSSSDILVDEYVYDSIFSIDQNTTIPQTIKYSIPNQIGKGNYKLWIFSRNSSGLILAAAYLGSVKIDQDFANTIEIAPDTCYIMASSSKYKVGNFVSVLPADKFTINCTVFSTYKNDVLLSPLFETRENSVYGNLVPITSEVSNNSINIKNGTNIISLVLPKALMPQTYTNIFSLVSGDKQISTNKIITDYSLGGDSGSVMNIVFDKTSYKKGDTAKIQIYSLVSIGYSGTTTISTSSVELSVLISNQQGQPCSDIVRKNVDTAGYIIELDVPINKDCVDPKADVTLSATKVNGENVVLDTQKYDISTPKGGLLNFVSSKTGIISIIILILLIIVIFAIKSKKSPRIKITLLILLSCISLFGLSTGTAKADSYGYRVGYNSACNYNYTVNLDKNPATYSVGSNIVVTGTLSWYSNDRACDYQSAEISNTGIDLTSTRHDLEGLNSGYLNNGGSTLIPKGNHNGSLTIVNNASLGVHTINYTVQVYYGTNVVITWPYPCNCWLRCCWCLPPCNSGCETCRGQTWNDTGYRGRNAWSDRNIPFTSVPQPIIINLTVTPVLVQKGVEASTISWNTTGATSCTLSKSGSVILPVANTSGSVTSGPLTTDTVFTLNCLGPNSTSASKSITVKIKGVNLNASSLNILSGDPVTIFWTASNANSCSINKAGAAFSSPATSGSRTFSSLTPGTTIFSASCIDILGGTITNQISVYTNPPTPWHIKKAKATKNQIEWEVTGEVDACALEYPSGNELEPKGVTSGVYTLPEDTTEGLTYFLKCYYKGGLQFTQSITTIKPDVMALCVAEQTNASGNISTSTLYVNKKTTWKVTTPNSPGADITSYSWTSADGINSSASQVDKIYTTVGKKTINGTFGITTSDGAQTTVSCTGSTGAATIKIAPGTSGEI